MAWKEPTCSPSLDQGLSWGPKNTLLPCPLSAGTELGNAFLLDLRPYILLLCGYLPNRKMNQITILDIQIKTDLAYQSPFWISNQEHNILNCHLETQHSGGPPRILECKMRIPNFLDDFIRSSTFQNAYVPIQPEI